MTLTEAKKYLARAKKAGAAISSPEILTFYSATERPYYGINVETEDVQRPIISADTAEEHFPVKRYTMEA